MDRIGGRQDGDGAILLEDHQSDPVAALVGVGEEREDGALGGRHPLGDGHRPGGVHHKQDEVARLAHADLLLKVGRLDGEGHLLPLIETVDLVGGGRPQGGVERDVVGLAGGGAGSDVAAALAIGASQAATAALAAGDAIDGVGQAAGSEDGPDLDFVAALPPVGAQGIEDRLFGRLRLAELFGLVGGFFS
jgi:hypothetical protein